jgi:hypothetical protein
LSRALRDCQKSGSRGGQVEVSAQGFAFVFAAEEIAALRSGTTRSTISISSITPR